MAKLKVAVIVGSLRRESLNLRLAKVLAKLGQPHFDAIFVRIDDLPLFNQDLESSFPTPALRMKKEIASADAVLIVTPEYNRATPAPLKNAVDWASRPYGQNSFAQKPTAIIGISPGAIGTACAQHNLRPTLAYLDAIVMAQPEGYIQYKEGLIDDDSNVTNEKTHAFLDKFVEKFVAWSRRHATSN